MTDRLPGHIRRRDYERAGRRWTRFVATIELPDLDGRGRRERSFKLRREAEAWMATQRSLLAQHVQLDGETPTVAALLRAWLEYGEQVDGWSPSHVERSRRIIERDLAPLHAMPADRLSVARVEALFAARRREGASPGTIRLVRNVLRAALNVAGQARPPQIPKHIPRYLEPEHVPAFLEALEPERMGALYVVTTSLALRPSEALGLRWEDVDLDGGAVHIGHTIQYVDGRYHEGAGKTDESRATVALPDFLRAALSQHRQKQLVERMAADRWDDPALVFTNMTGGPLHEPYVRKRLYIILERAGLPRVAYKELRHTGATLMLAAGVPLEQVRETLRHTNVATTERYAQVTPALMRDAAAKMDAFLRRVEGE